MTDPHYRIVVKGELGSSYLIAFDGMRLEPSDGDTAIIGPMVDQAQLQGILARITSLNLVLLSVGRVEGPATAT